MGEHLLRADHASLGPWADSLGWAEPPSPSSAPGMRRMALS